MEKKSVEYLQADNTVIDIKTCLPYCLARMPLHGRGEADKSD